MCLYCVPSIKFSNGFDAKVILSAHKELVRASSQYDGDRHHAMLCRPLSALCCFNHGCDKPRSPRLGHLGSPLRLAMSYNSSHVSS